MPATLLLLFALSPGTRAPDLQVEAENAIGVDLPELAEALAHALVASGARVVLGGPANDPCARCARVVLVDLGKGHCRVDVIQNQHTSSVGLTFDPETTLFERVRAVAIQARLLVTGEAPPETKRKEPRNRIGGIAPEAVAESEAVPGAETPSLAAPAPPEDKPPEPHRTTRPTREPTVPRISEDSSKARAADRADLTTKAPVLLPAPETVAQASKATSPHWPWIPTAVGAGAAVAAGLCLLVAKSRYDAMADRSKLHVEIIELKNEGEAWQTAAMVTSGVAVIGLATGIVGFATAGSRKSAITPTATVLRGGGLVALTGVLP